jgi:mutator protein MutT
LPVVTHDSEVRVLAAVLEDTDGRLLLCRRPIHKRHGGLWEFPGGKIEAGESPLDAARRELREELHLSVESVDDLLFSSQDPGSHFVIEFYRVVATGVPNPTEHSEIARVRRDELLALTLAPSDERFARFLTQLRPC